MEGSKGKGKGNKGRGGERRKGKGRGVEERGGEGKGRDDRSEGLIERTRVSRRNWKNSTSNN